ncbi:hypothetical protein TNCV_2857521 [Trichonephila clavipes]|nr:hypothetical protein TNCV_2857521 [Trichonephila clavipes]
MIRDNGPQFISEIFEHLSNRLGIQHVKTVVYRPQSNRTERVNHDLLEIIAKRKSGERKQLWQNKIQAGTICGQREQKELTPDHPVNRLNTIREPVRSRGRRVPQSTPYYKDQGCKQRSTSQSREEIKRGSSSCQNSRRRGAQQQQRQEIGGKSTSRKVEQSTYDVTPRQECPTKRAHTGKYVDGR